MRAAGIILKALRWPLLWLLAMTAAQTIIMFIAFALTELNS